MSIRKLSTMTGLNHTDISKLERNQIKRPSAYALLKLSDALGVNLFALYMEESEKYFQYQSIINNLTSIPKEELSDVIESIELIIKEHCK